MLYDPTKKALYQPELQTTVMTTGLSTAALCAELARLAYIRFETSDADEQSLQAALAQGGLGAATVFSTRRTATQGFAVRSADGRSAYVVFRGTQADDPTDLGTDADVLLCPWPGGGRAHAGFSGALASVWDSVGAWLRLPENAEADLWFTGHSLGAALATLAASQWGRGKLVTFGSPRVGDAQFVAALDPARTERYVDCCDIVSLLPPELLGYQHAGPMRYIDAAGTLVPEWSDNAIEIDRAEARLSYLARQAWHSDNNATRSLSDHAPVNYLRAFFP